MALRLTALRSAVLRSAVLQSTVLTPVLLAVAGLAFTSTAAKAADQVVLKYGVLQRSIAVSDLETFAETGELTRPLQRYIRISGEQPERIRQTLTREFTISPRLLDRLLNNPLGEAALGQLSGAIYPPSGSADPAALRSALVLSASDDDRISILELVRNYPTPQVYIDTQRVVQAYNQFRDLSDRLAPILEGIGI